MIDHIHDAHRRIYTDGRDWPEEVEPTFLGHSIGKWMDTDRDGRFDTLEVETPHMKGPRVHDVSGLPLHRDNQTVIKERLRLDKSNRNVLLNEITVIDNALTRLWTVNKKYHREPAPQPVWREYVCAANNIHVSIGKESHYLSAEGLLMPAKKD